MAIRIMTVQKNSNGQQSYEFIKSPDFDRKSEAEQWITKNAGDTTDFLLVGSPKQVKLIREVKLKVEEVSNGENK